VGLLKVKAKCCFGKKQRKKIKMNLYNK